MTNDLTRATTRGVMWSGISQVSQQGFQLIVIAILARLLFPEDFGVIALAVFFIGLVGKVRLGFPFSIIQRKEISQSQLSTLFWTGAAVGAGLWGVCAAASPLVAAFLNSDVLRPILVVLSTEFIISSLGLVQGGLLSRNLEFKKLAIVEIGGSLASGLFSISLAYAHFGVWSLVWGNLFGSLVTLILLWKLCPWRPEPHFSFRSLRELSGFGAAVVGNSVVNHIGNEMDKLVVGRVLGSGMLGLFSQASRITQLPRLNLSQVVTRVTFSALSRIQDEDARLRYAYLKSATYVAMVTFPLLVGLAIVAPEFVRVVYGERWMDMVLPMQILCLAGMAGSLAPVLGVIGFVKGRADLLLKLNLVQIPFIIVALLVGARYGIVGVAIAVSVFFIASVLFVQVFMNRLIRLKIMDYLRSLYPAALGATSMMAVLLLVRWLAATSLSVHDLPLLILLVIVGALTYFFTLVIARIEELGEIRDLAAELLLPYGEMIRRSMIKR